MLMTLISKARHGLLLILLCGLAACSPPPLVQQQAYVFGTLVEVSVYGVPEAHAQRALTAVLARFDTLHRTLHAWEVVTHEERSAVLGTGLLECVDLEVLRAARALKVRRERCHAARSIFAPSTRRRSSSASYPRSICSTLLMIERPFAHSVAASSAMPARMSGLRRSLP